MFNVNKINEATLIAIDTETCDPNLKEAADYVPISKENGRLKKINYLIYG